MAESTNSPRRVSAAHKKRRALELRKAGFTYQRIADSPTDPRNGDERRLFANKGSAHKAVTEALRELRTEAADTAEDVRDLELLRLDEWTASLWRHQLSGDTDAIKTGLAIQQRRSKVLGLDFADGLEERRLADIEGEVNRTQEAFEKALRIQGLSEDEVEEVFGAVARLLSTATSSADRPGPAPEGEGPGP